ncbi:MAG: hypothetical protein ACLFUL_14440 [Desulfobacteraceae bacterium]
MGQEDKSLSGIPISGALAVVAVILGLLVIPQAPFKASRPQTPGRIVCSSQEGENVQARLWQDPFAAVKSHRQDMKCTPGHTIDDLKAEIALEDKNLLVLGVMVRDEPYAEDIESRIRWRYAVLSALGESRYVPMDAEHIGYVENVEFNEKDQWSLDVLPYEWFQSENDSNRLALVLWLDDSRFYGSPLKRLSELAGRLREKLGNGKGLGFRILGPPDSTILEDMVKEDNLDPCEKYKDNLEDVYVFSWAATVDAKKVGICSIGRRIEQNCEVCGEKKLKFICVIGPDQRLTDLLVDELGLRIQGLLPGENGKNSESEDSKVHIALISEWDTVYGRNLPEAFVRSVAEKSNENASDLDWIHQFSYMRGIDGLVPGEPKTGIGVSAPSKKNESAPEGENIERPVGRSQFDYLRRLASRLKKLDEKIIKEDQGEGIQAIGVLGSDVYDKLLVLQAMHNVFPDVIFFTTDMDARLLHPDELKWTQNLVIASNFGLRLNDDLQKQVPPFRDNYQTSLFLSTKMALLKSETLRRHTKVDESSEDSKAKKNPDFKWLDEPRIFEVGHSDAFVLKTEAENKESPPICRIMGVSSTSLHPLCPKPGNVWMYSKCKWFCFGAAGIFAAVFLMWYSWFWKRHGKKGIEGSTAYLLAPWFLVLFMVAVVMVLTRVIQYQLGTGEPFAFFEGISLWPSEFLRFLAGGLAAYFLIIMFIKARLTDQKLADRYFVPAPKSREKGSPKSSPLEGANQLETASFVWNQYKKYTSRKWRWIRIASLGVIYFGLCALIISMFGRPFVPYRGPWSFWVDRVSLFFSIPLFIVLLLSVVDFSIVSGWMIRRVSRDDVIWPKGAKAIRDFGDKFHMDAAYLKEWADIQVIVKISETVGRFVYYPFIVIIILGASRLRYFDRWDLPIGLLIVMMLGLFYSVYCAVSLRRSAQRARNAILNRLWERQLYLKSTNQEELSEQVKMMYDAIRSMRRGAFVPFFEQPFVRAVALFLGGGGSLMALNYM